MNHKNNQMATSCERARREKNGKGFLLRQERAFNVCVAMVIWNILSFNNYYRIRENTYFVLSKEFLIYVIFVFYLNSGRFRCVCLSSHAGLFLVKCVFGPNLVQFLL